jgi:hypothetical protein
MQNESHCSSNPSQPSSSTPPPNAFTPEFLKALEAREDAPLAALEADSRGPWKVVQLPLATAGGGGGNNGGNGGDGDGDGNPEAERWIVLRSWEKPSTDSPAGTFRFREHALLWAAALEVASRGSDLGIGVRRDSHGQVIEEWLPEKGTRIVGHFPVWDQDVVAAMRVLSSLLRIPEALARVVDAGSAPVAELIGRRLVDG